MLFNFCHLVKTFESPNFFWFQRQNLNVPLSYCSYWDEISVKNPEPMVLLDGLNFVQVAKCFSNIGNVFQFLLPM